LAERLAAYDGGEQTKKLSKGKAEHIVREVRERVEYSWEFDRHNRVEAETDLRFLVGDQWPKEVRDKRKGRPMLTLNRLPQFLRQVTNDIRQADLSIKVGPVDNRSDPEVAKIYDGLIKQILYVSSARWVFSCAAEHQSACGIGWFRIKTCYPHDDTFDQEIRIERIVDPLSVFDDPGAILPDRSDAMWRCVVEQMPIKTFETNYPDAMKVGVDSPEGGSKSGFMWSQQDTIRVCEYWRKVPAKRTIALMNDGSTLDITDRDEFFTRMLPIVRTRKVDGYKIESYIVTGAEVLEGPMPWAGALLPIVPVVGAEVPMDGQIIRSGVIRAARDPQQLYNFSRSAAAEAIALAPKAPFMATAEQIGPYRAMWDSHNTENRPYLLYAPDPAAKGLAPTREHPPEMPAALYQECQLAADDMNATTGIYPASLGQRSNETSGIAIRSRQQEGDTSTYHFSDNLQFSLEYCGRVLIDLIPKIYDNERVLRIIGEDEGEEPITINQVVMGQDGLPVILNDLGAAKFDVVVQIAPSQTTRRLEAANFMIEFMGKLPPEMAANIADLAASYSDMAGADEVAKRLRNMIPEEIRADPDDPDAPPPPDPTQDPVFQMEAAEKQAKTEKTLADSRKSTAQAEEVEIRNALTVEQANNGLHETQQDPREQKMLEHELAEHGADSAHRRQSQDKQVDEGINQFRRHEDRQLRVEDQKRQAAIEARKPKPRQK
jgi:hypothetical protein